MAGLLNRQKKRPRPYHDLDWMAGAWTRREADRFDRVWEEQGMIDPELWK
jgi:hypothetical protein